MLRRYIDIYNAPPRPCPPGPGSVCPPERWTQTPAGQPFAATDGSHFSASVIF